jgi:hypothetical protein
LVEIGLDIGLSGTQENISGMRNFVTLFVVLNRFEGNIFFLNYVSLCIVYLILMVNADQQHILQTQTQNNSDSVRVTVTLWCGCVTIFDVEKQYVVHTLRGIF